MVRIIVPVTQPDVDLDVHVDHGLTTSTSVVERQCVQGCLITEIELNHDRPIGGAEQLHARLVHLNGACTLRCPVGEVDRIVF